MKVRIGLYILIALLSYTSIFFYTQAQKNKVGIQGSVYANSSYLLGYQVGHLYRINHFDMNNDTFIRGVQDGLSGHDQLTKQSISHKK